MLYDWWSDEGKEEAGLETVQQSGECEENAWRVIVAMFAAD